MKIKNTLKKVFSTPLLFFRFFKKSKIDNFVGGLIFGAIFSLFVNVFTVQLQEAIYKQRVLESVESEIVSNLLFTKNVFEFNLEEIKENKQPNYYHISQKYSKNVWENSEALKYVIELDPNTQVQLTTYYDYTVSKNNEFLEKDDELSREKLSNCYFNEGLNELEKKDCVEWYYQFLQNEISSAESVFNGTLDILEVFHPTQDRLNSPLLRLLMGSEVVEIMKRPELEKSNK